MPALERPPDEDLWDLFAVLHAGSGQASAREVWRTHLARDLLQRRVTKVRAHERAVRLDEDAVLGAVFRDGLLLAERLELRVQSGR